MRCIKLIHGLRPFSQFCQSFDNDAVKFFGVCGSPFLINCVDKPTVTDASLAVFVEYSHGPIRES